LLPVSGMTMERQELGKSGEDLAARELERLGYAILARRYRTKHGEIDIVARDGDTIVFVEVKARASDDYGSGAEALTWPKQRRLTSMATDYLARHRLLDRPCRFDVVTVEESAAATRITVYANAFDAAE
jgi:putative endonuclease